MALPLVGEHQPAGEVTEQLRPVLVADLGSEPDQDQAGLRHHVDVLGVLAPGEERWRPAVALDPPEEPVPRRGDGTVTGGDDRRVLDPVARYQLLALPGATLGVEHAELGEVDGPPVEAALHFLEAAAPAVQAPGAVGLHAEG